MVGVNYTPAPLSGGDDDSYYIFYGMITSTANQFTINRIKDTFPDGGITIYNTSI